MGPSMDQKVDSERFVLSEQVRQLFSSSTSAALANSSVALFFYLMVMESSIATHAGIWFSAILVISIMRMFMAHQFNNNKIKMSLERHQKIYLILMLLLGMCWGYASIMQSQLGNPDVRNFIILVYLALVAASISTISARLSIFNAFIAPQSLIIVITIMLEGKLVSIYTGGGLIIYTLLMWVLAKNTSNRIIASLSLKYENFKLIDDLNDEIIQRGEIQNELERHQEELENTVKERTHELLGINESLQKEIDERKQAEQNLRYAEQYDKLTGLPNRLLLLDRIKHAVSTAAREGRMIAILFMGIDGFKKINDSLGHAVGDSLLQHSAKRLSLIFRDADTVARNGGDEFVVVLEKIERAQNAEIVANKVITALGNNFNIAGHDVHIGISVGVSISPSDGEEPQQLLENADTAMHRSKQMGGNRCEFYSEGMSREIRERLDMENRLRLAIDNDELFMVYQPQVNSIMGQTIGFESLIRWDNPELGIVGPDRFVPLLEASGMIYQVGEWIIKEVAQFIQSGEPQGRRVSINLSARQCSQSDLGDFVLKVVDEFGIEPSKLEFELTESMLLDNFKNSTKLINQLQQMGCTIALDDFGTGYTSMSYLAQLNIDVIKIDRSFVAGIDSDDNLRKIVDAIIGMSQSMNIENVIEGVETAAELSTVRSLGGHIIQGYLYSKPLRRGEDVANWLSEN